MVGNITRGTGVTYDFYYGDGFSNLALSEAETSHKYNKPGTYSISATATDLWLNKENQTISVTVETNMTDVQVDCPLAVEYDHRFGCDFYIYQGTNLSATVDFQDGRVVTFVAEDAATLSYGQMLDQDESLNNQPTSRVYLMINSVIQHDGRIVAWEMNAITTGTVTLQVYRPRCTNNEVYCHRTASCHRPSVKCQEQASIWSKTCEDAGRFSFNRRDCVQHSDGSLEGHHVFSGLPLDYDFLSEITYSLSDTGRNFLTLTRSEQVDVQAGDVIGWYNSNSGKLAYQSADSSADGPEILPSTSNYGSRLSGGYVAYSSGASSHSYKHALKAHVVRPSHLHVFHNYTWPESRRNISINASNNLASGIWDMQQEIKVMEKVSLLSFNAPLLAVVTEEQILTVNPHLGTEVTYHWFFGNGDEHVTQEMFTNYTWMDDGVYNITLRAYNDISQDIYEHYVVLQHRIQEFEWKDSVPKSSWTDYPITPKIFGSETVINFGMTLGTNVTYEINIGDGIVPTFFLRHDEVLDIGMLLYEPPPPTTTVEPIYQLNCTFVLDNVTVAATFPPTAPPTTPPVLVDNGTLGNMTFGNLTFGNETAFSSTTPFYEVIQTTTPSAPSGQWVCVNVTINGNNGVGPMTEPARNLSDRLAVEYNGVLGSVYTVYEKIGYYPVIVNASNRVSWALLESMAVIQIEITNFHIIDPPPLKFGETQIIGVGFDTGTNLSFSGSFAGNDLDLTDPSLYYMDDVNGEGYIVIGPEYYSDRGFYDLELTTWNLVSGPITDIVQVQVEFAITDFQMEVSEMYIVPYTTISIRFDMEIGSDLTMVMDTDDGWSKTFQDIEMKRPDGDHYIQWHEFGVARDYNITIHATSAVSDELIWIEIKVQNPVVDLSMTVYTPGVIPYMEIGTIRYEYLFYGDQSMPPTDATVEYYLAKGIEPVEDFPIAETNPVVHNLSLAVHGPYSTFVNISNLVSWMNFTQEIEMEKPILGLIVTCKQLHIRVGSKAVLTATIDWGSRVRWRWYFQDSDEPVELGIVAPRTRRHPYKQPGTYYVSVVAYNLLGEVEYTIPEPVKVQYPVQGMEWIGRRLSRLYVANIYVGVPFHLLIVKTVPFPTEASYEIDFGDGQTIPARELNMDRADSSKDTDTQYHVVSETHYYDTWGHYNVTIRIWNLVSDVTLLYDIWIYETITQLQKEVNYNELIIDGDYSTGNETFDQEGFDVGKNYFRLEEAIVVKATMASGTGLTYTWDFGDLFFEPPPTTPGPTYGPTTMEPTTLPLTTYPATTLPPNCTYTIEEWAGNVVDELTLEDEAKIEVMNASLIPNCSYQEVMVNVSMILNGTWLNSTDESGTDMYCVMVNNTDTNSTLMGMWNSSDAVINTTSIYCVKNTTNTTGPIYELVCDDVTPVVLLTQRDLCEKYDNFIGDLLYNRTFEGVQNFTNVTHFELTRPENDTSLQNVNLMELVDELKEYFCLNLDVLSSIGEYLLRNNFTTTPSLCPPPEPTRPPTTEGVTTPTPPTEPPTTLPPYVVRTTEPRAIWWYTKKGVYTITLNVSNPVHWVVVEKTIVVQRGIFDMVLTDHGPRARNTTIEFELDTGNAGTDVCYYVDFRDKQSEINQIAFWGHRRTCEDRYAEEFQSPFLRFTEVSNAYLEGLLLAGRSPNITLSNIFQSVNAFRIIVRAHNKVSEQTVTLRTAVTKGPCFYPEVNVRDNNGCDQYYPFCDSDGHREYFASKDVYVYSYVKINCTSTPYTMYTWRAFSIDDNNGVETEIFDLGDTEMAGFTRRELAVKKFVLPYGLYRFELNVSMWGERGVESIDSTTIRVVPTPLVVRIGGGSERIIRWNDQAPVDGYSETLDPDVDPSDRSGLRYVWMCRRQHETYQEWNDDYTVMLKEGGVNASYIHEKGDLGGCFGRYGYDASGYGGMLNVTSGTMVMDTYYMHEQMVYELKLIVFKDTRQAEFTQVLYVATGSPPRMEISCKTNCKTKLNPTSRFALESRNLDYRRGMILYYRWEIYEAVSDGVATSLEVVDRGQWLSFSGTGDDMANLAIDAGFFKDESAYRIRIYCDRSPDFTNYGMASLDLITNERPIVGNCSVVPENGTALETEFNIFCNDWIDPDLPLTFRYAQRLLPTESWTWMYSGEKPYMDVPSIFPQGYESEDFYVYILVRVDDYIGSYSDLELRVQVVAPALSGADMTEKLKNLTSGEGSVMSEMISSGDAGGAANIVAACAGMLNIAASNAAATMATTVATHTATTVANLRRKKRNAGEEGELTEDELLAARREAERLAAEQAEAERLEREQMRESMMGALSLSSPNNVGSMKQLASAFVQASGSSEEISPTAAQNSMNTGLRFMNLLQEKAGEAGADEVEESGKGILSMTGNAVSGIQNKAAKARAAAASVAASQAALMATGAPEVSDDYTSSSSSVDLEALEAETEAEVAAMNDLLNVVIEYTSSVGTSREYGTSGGSSFKLPSVESMLGSGNDTTLFVDAQVVIEKENSKTWSNSSSDVAGQTAKLSFRNETGGAMDIKNLPEPIEVWVERADDQMDTSTIETVFNQTTPMTEQAIIHTIMNAPHTSMHLTVNVMPYNYTDVDNVTLYLYLRVGQAPTIDLYDFNCTLPKRYDGYEYVNVSLDDLPDPNTCFFSNTLLDSYGNGSTVPVYVIIKHTGGNNESNPDYLASSQYNNFWQITYAMRPWSAKCSYYEEETEEWLSDGCEVGEKTTLYKTQCFTTHLTAFGGGFQVPINDIDLSDSAFGKLDENPLVFMFMTSCLCVYMTVMLWAYKADQRDKVKAGATPLADNDPRDHYMYEITVFTGVRASSNTTAKVSLIITGDAEESRPRLLDDPARKVFQVGGIDTFLLAAPRSLGNLQHLRVWHDNTGKAASWYLSRIAIKDLQTDKMYYFMLDRWLAVEEDDGQIERVIPVAGKSELTSFGFLFYSKTRRNLSDGHLWFSVFARPARSSFTRMMRCTCCLSLLFSTMMSNIFFYNVDVTGGSSGGSFVLGPISVSVGEICVGVISSLMVMPANLIIVQMFRLSKPIPDKINWFSWFRKKKPGEGEKSTEEVERDKTERMDEKAASELEKQLEFLNTGDNGKRLLKSARSRTVRFADEAESSQEVKDASGPETTAGSSTDSEGMKLVAGVKTRKKKPKFMLPWGCQFIGWTVAVGTVGVSFWLTIEVAGQFGPEKAAEWLSSMACSLVQDIFFSQPIKVLCLATFYALVIKRPDKEDDQPSTPHLKSDEEYLHERLTEEELKDPEKLAQLERQKQACPIKPPDTDELNEARETRFKEIKMQAILKEIAVYMFYLYILLLIGYGNKDPSSHAVYTSVHNTFINAQYYGTTPLSSVSSRQLFWKHMREVFVPSLYAGNHYNDELDDDSFQQKYVADRAHVLLGTARLRQVRVYTNSCKVEEVMRVTIDHCIDEYSAADDVEISYDEGWQPVNETTPPDYDSSPMLGVWKYRDWLELDSYPAFAHQNSYYGGGFTVEFGTDILADMEMIDYLQQNLWVDQQTRAIFLEYVVYNPVTNTHVVSLNVLEFPPTGGVFPFIRFQTMTLDHYYGTFAYFVLAAEVIFALLLLFYVVREAAKIKKQKKQYFKDLWNIYEVITDGLAVGAIVAYLYRLLQANELTAEIQAAPTQFHNFQFLAYWDDIYVTMVTLCLFMAVIKFTRLLRFNIKILMLSETVNEFAYELSLFMVMFAVVYMGYASFCFLVFYQLHDFSSFLRTLESLFGTLLGKFSFEDLVSADPIMGPIFFFSYVMVVMWTLINMLLAIICEAFAKVKEDAAQRQNELEIVDFMVTRFKAWSGFSEKRVKNAGKVHTYIEGIDPIQAECDDLKFKLDDMVSKLNDFIKATKKEDRDVMGIETEEEDKPRVIYLG
ncbi:uncharacterized protein LOC110976208 [Acanthaster planci]|uniref:Uncharacterized protein LOC110976208 n=1 Tax=Acanthaster planci TaxID=133434 RepID=A0A8B7XVU5_ACAPL|nr:uncharacterized protein LOC110976208 [Acanthaster planci]